MKTMRAIKIILILLVVGFIVLLEVNTVGNRSATEIYQEISGLATDSNRKLGGDGELKRYYQINPSSLESFVIYVPDSSQHVSEILLLKAKSESDMNDLKDKVENRLETQKKTFEGYNADNVSLLQNAKISETGKYLFFVVGSDADALNSAFKKAVKK